VDAPGLHETLLAGMTCSAPSPLNASPTIIEKCRAAIVHRESGGPGRKFRLFYA
jgi:hypothetical protein